ncbi:MAG: hypothetical protein AB7I50_05180 [Vicinamibacterales bacterium]
MEDWHQRRSASARNLEAVQRRQSGRLSTVRLLIAACTAAATVAALRGVASPAAGWVAAAGVGAFLVIVVLHDRVERRIRWHAAVADWHDERHARRARAWDRLPDPWLPDIPAHHPFARDLDLFGRASVFELVGPPGTVAGRQVLAAWLLHPARVEEVGQRQEGIRELVADASFREHVAAHGRIIGAASTFDLRIFLEWAEGEHWLSSRPWLVHSVRLLALANIVLVAAQAVGAVESAWWIVSAAAGLALSWLTRHHMEHTLGRATGWEPTIRAYVEWLQLVETHSASAPILEAIRLEMLAGGEKASESIARFQRLVSLAEIRHNALLHFPIHALTLWDFHVWERLERWQRQRGGLVRRWLDALARLEGLTSVATFAGDHEHWAEPDVSTEHRLLSARQLGHPLLAPDACVRNDVHVGPPGRVVCITGSNMSGKSTLLRAIGVNAVLAQMGAPVCAEQMCLPPLSLFASLRVMDSLSEGVSFFMAALGQLKQLVEAADAAATSGEGDRPLVFYLLDEILQGTNSVEREAAVRIVLRHLLSTPAIGVMTTHDLALTDTPELRQAGDHFHFRETLHETPGSFGMTFDYTLRPGVATSRNALALLRLVGLSQPMAATTPLE